MAGSIRRAGCLHHVHRQLGQIPHHRFDVASDVAYLGILAGLHLDERGINQLSKAASDLSLTHTGRADHDDVLRRHLIPQFRRQLLPPPSIAQRNRYGPLGFLLTDDIFIKLGHDLSWC